MAGTIEEFEYEESYRDFPDDRDSYDAEALDEMAREDAMGFSFEEASEAGR